MDFTHCMLCPRRCGADRTTGRGRCGMGEEIRLARAALHTGEEPCISGKNGSGAVFFSGCVLGCVFCQNAEISQKHYGKAVSAERLSEIFLELQAQGAHNINLVSAAQFAPQAAKALEKAKPKLKIPVVYNTGGYESCETLKAMEGLVDVYLPDLKYKDTALSRAYSGAADYFEVASRAVCEMYRQVGPVRLEENGLMTRGVLVRHLLLPGCRKDAMTVIDFLCRALPADKILFSLMSQYTPCYKAVGDKKIGRRVTTFEAESVREYAVSRGLSGFSQDRSAATGEYIPAFDLTGVTRQGKTSGGQNGAE